MTNHRFGRLRASALVVIAWGIAGTFPRLSAGQTTGSAANAPSLGPAIVLHDARGTVEVDRPSVSFGGASGIVAGAGGLGLAADGHLANIPALVVFEFDSAGMVTAISSPSRFASYVDPRIGSAPDGSIRLVWAEPDSSRTLPDSEPFSRPAFPLEHALWSTVWTGGKPSAPVLIVTGADLESFASSPFGTSEHRRSGFAISRAPFDRRLNYFWPTHTGWDSLSFATASTAKFATAADLADGRNVVVYDGLEAGPSSRGHPALGVYLQLLDRSHKIVGDPHRISDLGGTTQSFLAAFGVGDSSVHVLWTESSADGHDVRLHHATVDTRTWAIVILPTLALGGGYAVSAVMSDRGRITLSYESNDRKFPSVDLRGWSSNSGWSDAVAVDPTTATRDGSLTLDRDGCAVVAYVRVTGIENRQLSFSTILRPVDPAGCDRR